MIPTLIINQLWVVTFKSLLCTDPPWKNPPSMSLTFNADLPYPLHCHSNTCLTTLSLDKCARTFQINFLKPFTETYHLCSYSNFLVSHPTVITFHWQSLKLSLSSSVINFHDSGIMPGSTLTTRSMTTPTITTTTTFFMMLSMITVFVDDNNNTDNRTSIVMQEVCTQQHETGSEILVVDWFASQNNQIANIAHHHRQFSEVIIQMVYIHLMLQLIISSL